MSRLEGRNWKLHVGDCLDVLRTMPDESVHCCVTSPPYWGLRDYGVDPTEWPEVEYQPMAGLSPVRVPAMKSCLGLEPTLEAFVGHIVLVFQEVRRVLRHDGTLWLNLGDSYATGAGKVGDSPGGGKRGEDWKQRGAMTSPNRMPIDGLKPKDLCGIPWRVAFALQADGWWLRQDIIWNKPSPMPESVRDRGTKAHEYVFLMSKSQHYFYDAEAIKEPVTGNAHSRGNGTHPKMAKAGSGTKMNESFESSVTELVSSRNRRSVWTVASQPFSGAHFATFPPKLIEPCILAGTSDTGCCVACGAPWDRIVERLAMVMNRSDRTHALGRTRSSGTMSVPPASKTTGWQPTCECGTGDVEPCVVLDPFAGSGTTLAESVRLNRRGLGIELNPEYAEEIAKERIGKEARQPVLF